MTTIYGTVGEADDYFTERTNAVWLAADDTAKAAALLVASEWIDGKYGEQFSGWKTLRRAQDREWPRTGAYDDMGDAFAIDEIPDAVKRATYEVALREIASPGSLITDVTLGKNIVQATVQGAVSVTYAGATDVNDLQLMIPVVAMILRPVLTAIQAGYSDLSVPSRRV